MKDVGVMKDEELKLEEITLLCLSNDKTRAKCSFFNHVEDDCVCYSVL